MTTKNRNNDSLSIIFPVYNEKETLEIVLQEWTRKLNQEKVNFKIIVCEDGSTDGTKELLKKIKSKYKLILNQKKERRGYGTAVIDGIKSASTKFILCIDSDGQCDPKDFRKFWNERNNYDVIIGKRVKRADKPLRKIYSGLFKVVFLIFYGNKISDPSAPFVLFERKLILPLINYLEFLKEGFWWGFSATAVKKKLSVKQININHRLRINGNTQVYKISKIPSIASRNLIGLLKLRFV